MLINGFSPVNCVCIELVRVRIKATPYLYCFRLPAERSRTFVQGTDNNVYQDPQ